MKRLFLLVGTILVVVALTLSGCAAPAPAPAVEKPHYEFTLAQYQSVPDFPNYQVAEEFKALVEEASNGRIIIKHFPGDLLGNYIGHMLDVKRGSLDIAYAANVCVLDPDGDVINVPYQVFDWEGFEEAYGPGSAGAELLKTILLRNNCYTLGVSGAGFVIIVSTKKFVPLPGDPSIKGIKTRVMPSAVDELLGQTFGFMTLSMPFSEVHSGLMLGTIDAAMGPSYGEAPLFKDVVKYLYRYNYCAPAGPWIMNLPLWNSLSAEDQEILQTAMDKAMASSWDRAPKIEQDAIAEMVAAGVEIVELTPEQMRANVKECRDNVWPLIEAELLPKEIMDMIRGFAQPAP